MKRKNKLIGFILVVVGILSYLGMAIANKLEHKEEVKTRVAKLAYFSYTSLDDQEVKIKQSDRTKVIFFFNPDCEHCQSEAELIAANMDAFANAEVYFFSMESLESIQDFAKKHKIEDFKVGKVDYKSVAYPMGVNTFPICFIYAPTGELLQQYKGEVKLEAITKFIP